MPALQLLGGFALYSDAGERLVLPRKSRALLAYLALAEGRPVPREKLATLMWEDSSEAQARASLRQAIAAIRRVEGPEPLLLADAETCALAPEVTVDLADFDRAGDAEARAQAFRGDLLDGFSLPEAGFSAWLATERARVRDRAIEALGEAAEAALAARRHDAAIAAAQRLVALDQLHEAGHRLLMRAYAETGRPAEALRQYRALQDLLRRELGAAPEPETVAVARQVSQRRQASAPAPSQAPAPQPGVAEPASADPATETRRELRRMTILSVGIAGFAALSAELDLEVLERVLAATHAIVEEEAEHASGHVLDRHSDVLTILFGAGTARDDDPLRAARTAHAIHARLAAEASSLGAPVAARIGLTAGPILLVQQGGQITALGEPLATAAQLRALADPGATIVPGPLLVELDGRFETVPAGRHAVGSIHRLVGPAAELVPPPLVGRAAELAQVEALLDVAAGGSARTLIVRGAAGIGKSRLAEAAVEAARGRGWRVLRAVIADFGEFATITPRRQLVLGLLGLTPDSPLPDTLADHPFARALSPDEVPILYRLAGGLAPKGAAQKAAGAAEVAESARDRVFGALLSAATAEAPLLILVEDSHWASAEVLGQLQTLSRKLCPLPALLLVTTRPEPDRFDHAWRAGAGPLSTIDLGPLGRADSLAVARSLGVSDPEAAAELAARAGGNPLFLRQLIAAVNEGAAISEALPGSVQGLALGRLDLLSASERLALRAAALIGARAELEAVRAVSGLADYSPTPAAIGLLVRFDGHSLTFVHALIRDAVDSVTTPSERRALHLAAAEWYRQRNAELHARHLDRAGDPRAAAAWAEAAALELARHRPDKAQAQIAAGLAVAKTAADRFGLRICEARVRMRQLDFAGAREAAQSAQRDAPTDAQLVQALVVEADAETAAQQPDVALRLLDRAAALAEPAGLADAMARILGMKGNIHFPRGNLAQCLADHGSALVWARRAASTLAEAGALAGLGWAHYQRGAFAEACHHADQCLALAGDRAFDRIRLAALRVRSVSRIFLLQHDGALADAEAAIALAAEQGDVLNEIFARTTAGTVHLERWERDEAVAMASPALALAETVAGIGVEAAPLWVLGTAHGTRGEVEQARALLERARDSGMRGRAIRFAVPRILGTLAFFVDSEARASMFGEGERLLAATPVAHSANGFYGSALHAALVNAEHDLADRCAEGLRRHQTGEAEPWVAALLELATHFTALSRGDRAARDPARRFHDRARQDPALNWLRPTMRTVEARL